MPTARGALAAATAGGSNLIFAIGGRQPTMGTTEAYDTASDTWSVRADMPTPRDSFVAVTAADGRVYAIGGENTGTGAIYDVVEAYDPVTDTWTPRTAMPTRRQGPGGALGLDGRIHVIGGFTGPPFAATGRHEAYDPVTDSWTTLAPLPTARTGLAVATGSDGRIYAFGGFGATPVTAVDAYDPVTDTWISRAPLSHASAFLSAVAAPDGRIYVLGGFDGSSDLASVEAYDPAADSWAAVAPLPAARCDFGAALGPDNKIYAIGGSSCAMGGSLDSNEAFTLPSAAPMLTAAGPARGWLGLVTSDDQGTRFDLRAEVYRNDGLVTTGLTRCITGVTRSPSLALEALVNLAVFGPVTLASGDILSLKLSARIGTKPDDTKCGGHNNAVGLRVYYDAVTRASRVEAGLSPDPPRSFYLHTSGVTDFLSDVAPAAATAVFKDSPALNFAGGNPWKTVGTWSMTVP
jgi:hypothetical protein